MRGCLMMDEHETWQMHGFNSIEHANNTSSTWNEFMAAIKILNVENHKDFTQHLMCLHFTTSISRQSTITTYST